MGFKPGIWLEASRPKTLWAAVSPVILGVAIAIHMGGSHALAAVLAMAGAVLIQVATNFHNDVSDFEKGADTEDRVGPRRMVADGLITAGTMRRAVWITFALAVLSGVWLMMRGGLPIVLIGIASIIFGLAYTGGRYSLAYLGIADFFVLAFFGPVAVAGTVFVQALEWPTFVWIAGLSPGLLCMNILLVNNLRDRDQDAAAGKKTLVVRTSRRAVEKLYLISVLLAVAIPVALVAQGIAPWTVLISLLAVLPCIATWRRIIMTGYEHPQALNPLLGETARNLLIHTVLTSIGWVIPL